MASLIKNIIRLLPPTFGVWAYTTIFRPAPLRRIADSLIKSSIPPQISIPEGVVILNQNDAAVSGQIALDAYERFETELFRQSVKEGMTVVDLGANIGYFTVIAGKLVGSKGRIYSYEPEPDNNRRLRQNIEVNHVSHAQAIDVALSDKSGRQEFYITEENRGTHSLSDNRGTGKSIMVETDTLDASLSKFGSPVVDVMKMDIEGAEALALAGMKETIRRSSSLVMFVEFFPHGLLRFGKQPVQFLRDLEGLGFSLSVIDESKKITVHLPPADFDKFVESFPDNKPLEKNLYAVKGLARQDKP